MEKGWFAFGAFAGLLNLVQAKFKRGVEIRERSQYFGLIIYWGSQVIAKIRSRIRKKRLNQSITVKI